MHLLVRHCLKPVIKPIQATLLHVDACQVFVTPSNRKVVSIETLAEFAHKSHAPEFCFVYNAHVYGKLKNTTSNLRLTLFLSLYIYQPSAIIAASNRPSTT